MSDETLTKVLAGLQGRRFRGRSDLYRWLRASYKRLAPRLAQDQVSWGVLAQEIAAAGLKNRKGAPPSADSVRRIWGTVCRDLAREAAVKAQRRTRKYPSRISPNWRPQVVEPSRPMTSAGPRAPSSPSVSELSLRGLPGRQSSEVVEFPTVDPSGAPLAEGHVFYRGQSMLRRVAEQLARIDRQARELDRFK
jgi:hypothetical protein